MLGCYLLEDCSFLMRVRKGVNPEGRGGREELNGVEGGKLEPGYIVWETNLVSGKGKEVKSNNVLKKRFYIFIEETKINKKFEV